MIQIIFINNNGHLMELIRLLIVCMGQLIPKFYIKLWAICVLALNRKVIKIKLYLGHKMIHKDLY